MKLFELIQTDIRKDIPSKKLKDEEESSAGLRDEAKSSAGLRDVIDRACIRTNKIRHLGSGLYSDVYSRNSPFSVIKFGGAYRGYKKDGYTNFIQACLKNQRSSSNPYLPRIYKFKTYTDGSYVVEIEKLTSLDDPKVNKQMIDTLGRQLFDNWNISHNDMMTMPEYEMMRVLLRYIMRVLLPNPYTRAGLPRPEVKDKKFLQALSIVNGLQKRNKNLEFDIHGGNFMIRFTSVGPQLVITDPLI